MPNLNGKGPNGKGSLTGRRRGRCKDAKTTHTETFENQSTENKDVDAKTASVGRPLGVGKGNRHGRGGGRGFRNREDIVIQKIQWFWFEVHYFNNGAKLIC